jgi:hypothetical protein
LSHRRRVAAVALLTLLLAVPLLSMGAFSAPVAANNSSSAQAGLSGSSGEYPLEELRTGGRQVENSPNSVRLLGDTGSIAVRHSPPGPFAEDWTYLAPGSTVQTNELTLYSTRFGSSIEPKEYELVVVYWQSDRRQVSDGNTTTMEEVADNQTVERHSITLNKHYDKANVSLRSHYDQSVEVSMWLVDPETDEPVDGAKWRFTHESIPTTQQVDIDTRGDALWWLGTNVLLIAIPGMLGSAGGAKRVLNQTARGPMLGWFTWLLGLGLLTLFLLAGLFVTTATVFARLPQLIGVLLAAIVFVAVLESAGTGRKVIFEKPILTDASSPAGEDVKDARYEEQAVRSVVRMEDGTHAIVRKGIRPFLARWWASPAKIDFEDLKTQIELRGPFERKYIADPDSEDVLEHTPARLAWAPPIRDEDADGFLESINWRFLVTAALSLGIGWKLGAVLVGVPAVGLLAGAVPVLLMCIEARDGEAEFVPAPIHQTAARATMAYEQSQYAEGRTLEDMEDIAWRERSRTALDARAVQSHLDRTVTEEMNERELGVGDDDQPDEPSTDERTSDDDESALPATDE